MKRNNNPRTYKLSLAGLALTGVIGLAGCPLTTICAPGDTSRACQAPCQPGDTRPHCQQQTVGNITLTWTIDGSPASSGCTTAGAQDVRITIGSQAPVTEPCAAGTKAFASLPEGAHSIVADLLDSGGTSLAQFSQSVTVIAGQTANVPVAFTTGGGGTGSVSFSWTVDGQSPSTACPASSQVSIVSTAGPTSVNQSFACDQGTAQIDSLAVGSYTFTATLLSGSNPTVTNLTVNVIAGQVASVSSFDLVTGGGSTGSATFTWTVNSQDASAACLQDGMVTVEVVSGTTAASPVTVACSTGTAQILALVAGSYMFKATLSQGGATHVVDNIAVEVIAGNDASVPSFNFATGASVTGTASFSWTFESGAKSCPAGSTISVSILQGPELSATASGDCTAMPLQMPSLPVGQYQFSLTLTSGVDTTTAMTPASPLIDIAEGLTADISVDFASCPFCP